MATNTTNIGLIKPESSDSVSLSVLNENSDILDSEINALKKDPISDRKTINGWEVFYYTSGEVECYKKINTGAINLTTASGIGGMYKSVLLTETLPITMIKEPSVFLSTIVKDVTNKMTLGIVGKITTTNFTYNVLINGSTKGKTYEVDALVKGRWK